MSHESHVLLTGATGLIGRKWLAKLLAADPSRQVTILTRSPEHVRVPDGSRVSRLRADVAVARLALADECYHALERSVTEIIHCAADIRFNLPLCRAQEVNANGTARLLDLARSCRKLLKFAHVSTVYIGGRSPGAVPETRYLNTSGFFNTYQQSKYEAEDLVASAMSEIPAAIFRLSSVIGDSNTGVVDQFNYFHQLLKFVPIHPLPIIPGVPDAPVDLIASDWAVNALSTMFEWHFEGGRFNNICAGPANSLTVREVVEMTFDQICSHWRYASNRVIKAPELVSLEEFEKFTRDEISGGDRKIRELLRALWYSLPHLGVRQAFENQATLAVLNNRGITLPPIRRYYPKVVQYCLDSDWGNSLTSIRGKS